MTLAEYLDLRRQAVEAALADRLPAPPHSPALVLEAMRYSLMAGGKRLRPGWVLLGVFTVRVVLEVIPQIPGLALTRDLGLAMYGAMLLWLTVVVRLAPEPVALPAQVVKPIVLRRAA